MKRILFSAILSICGTIAFAQDPSFSQPYGNPLYLNPALTGTGDAQRIGMNFRDQWPNIPGTYTTYGVSYDRNIIDSSNGIGLMGYQDEAGQGTLTTTDICLLYAHQFHIKSFTLSIGAKAAYLQENVSWTNLTFGNQISPTRGFVYNTSEEPVRSSISNSDFSVGFLGYGKHYFAGFAIDHVTQPDMSFVSGASPLPIKYTVNAGGIIPAGGFTLSPSILYIEQGGQSMKEFDGYIITKHITGGIGYRYNDAMIFRLGYQGKLLRVGYSYDYTVSALTNNTGGTHEATAAVLIKYKKDKFKKSNVINTPFF